MNYRVFMIMLLVVCLSVTGINAADLTGEEIVERLKDDSALTGSGTAIINLITQNSRGDQRSNKLKIFRQDDGKVEKQLLEYLEPADVRGTKFLSLNEEDSQKEQMWLFLPALGRERRIAGHMTKDSFMGTDFTYEEIGGSRNYSDNYHSKRLEDKYVDDYLCYQLELIPLDNESEYSRVMMCVWQEEYMPLKIEFYNLDGQLKKKLKFSKLKKEDDGDYMPQLIVMTDVLEETSTTVEVLERSNQKLPEDYFTMRYLRR